MWWPAVVKSEYVNQRLQIHLELLMMSGVPLETCWAFNERWNNKFCYKVASCWLFLLSQEQIKGKEEDEEKSAEWRRNKRKERKDKERGEEMKIEQKPTKSCNAFIILGCGMYYGRYDTAMRNVIKVLALFTGSVLFHSGKNTNCWGGLHVFSTQLLIRVCRYPKPNRNVTLPPFLTD
jgi:hypothetical protein